VLHCCQVLAPAIYVDSQKAKTCALGHDLFRATSPKSLLALAQGYGLPILPAERDLPMLLHGPLAARFLRDQGEQSEEVLEAIAWHTTGRAGMSTLEKVLFISDKVEPHKADTIPALQRAWALASQDLDQALLQVLEWQIESVKARGQPLHPATLEARDALRRS